LTDFSPWCDCVLIGLLCSRYNLKKLTYDERKASLYPMQVHYKFLVHQSSMLLSKLKLYRPTKIVVLLLRLHRPGKNFSLFVIFIWPCLELKTTRV
jgi:hypothetical protein